MFASSFKRADALALAMEARGYQGGEGRSKYRILQWQSRDTMALMVLFALGIALFLFSN